MRTTAAEMVLLFACRGDDGGRLEGWGRRGVDWNGRGAQVWCNGSGSDVGAIDRAERLLERQEAVSTERRLPTTRRAWRDVRASSDGSWPTDGVDEEWISGGLSEGTLSGAGHLRGLAEHGPQSGVLPGDEGGLGRGMDGHGRRGAGRGSEGGCVRRRRIVDGRGGHIIWAFQQGALARDLEH